MGKPPGGAVMTFRAFMQRAGKSAIRNVAVLLVFVLVLDGCSRGAQAFVVKAVAAGVPSLAPFFDESQGLAHDAAVRSQPVHSSPQQGDTPGLYGGTRKPTICDVARLKKFLTDPGNHRKAQAWADVLGITTDEIPSYLDRLTPVLLRHDTLVQNHDYRKGKAAPFNSLLQAGIAVLVDERGLPAVKCSCGNPLRPFKGDTGRISVTFENSNRKWPGYDRASVVSVRPAPRKQERLALVDVDDADVGISRPVGTSGRRDSTFDARERRTVPGLVGATFGEASRRLAERGLAVGYDGKGLPPDDARVTASDPPAGTKLRFGEYVTLSVTGGTRAGATTPPGTTASEPAKAPPSSSGGGSGPSSSGGGSGPSSSGGGSGPSSSGGGSGPSSTSPSPSAPSSGTPSGAEPSAPSSPAASESPRSSAPAASQRPPSSATPTVGPRTGSPPKTTGSPPKTTSAPPTATSAPPASAPVTSSAPITSASVTTAPAAPAAGKPASGAPGTRAPAPVGPSANATT
ncbi:DUF6777 domain-containing protein [Streptomyces sp. NPDC005202]|uniref:DUF6777 domain-containing protein n=1 Tax=Streptomyces sp. NPDC005202 TaxID=3157021 RepID=UPI0033B036A8